MKERSYQTEYGRIVYWTNDIDPSRRTLVLLPGLTADHRLFDRQIEVFESVCNVFVWDAPGHAASRPFELRFSLADKAKWLHEILAAEQITDYVLVGQSMGGYVSQVYLELYPDGPAAFVCIDSAPIQRSYMTAFELWMLRNVEPIYRLYPWRALLRDGARGCAETEYGIQLMRDMMEVYSDAPKYYCKLAGHGYRMLADAAAADLPYEITCPTVLICGEKDKAGSAKNYNLRWTKKTGLPLRMIAGAGHNSNSDKPEEINEIIREFAGV